MRKRDLRAQPVHDAGRRPARGGGRSETSSTAKKTARPTASSRLRTSALRSSSSTLMSLQRTAPQSGQLPTQLIWSVSSR